MEDRFRVDGIDLGVDRRRSFASVDADGTVDAVVRAAELLGGVPARLVVSAIPLRFDGDGFGATVDAETRDRLFLEGVAEAESDEEDSPDPAPDPGVSLWAGSRVSADGRLTHHAGDRLRFVGEAVQPGGAPLRLDVSLGFGGSRASRI